VGGSWVPPSFFWFHGRILAFLLAWSIHFAKLAVMPLSVKPEESPRRMLSEVVHEKLRAGHYSRRTEEAYLGWIRRFIRFHHGRCVPASSATVARGKSTSNWARAGRVLGNEASRTI